VLDELLEERVVSARGHRRPRGVKRKMSSYPLRPRAPSAANARKLRLSSFLLKPAVLGLSRVPESHEKNRGPRRPANEISNVFD